MYSARSSPWIAATVTVASSALRATSYDFIAISCTTVASAPWTAATMLRAASQTASLRGDRVDSCACWAASRRRSAAGDPSMNVTITAAAHNRSTRSGASAASNSNGSVSSTSAAVLSSGTPLPTRTSAACASS